MPIAGGCSRELKPLDNLGSLMILGAGTLDGDKYISNAIMTLWQNINEDLSANHTVRVLRCMSILHYSSLIIAGLPTSITQWLD